MLVNQVANFVNSMNLQGSAGAIVLDTNFANIVDVGKDIGAAMGHDKWTDQAVDRIAKDMWASDAYRTYRGVMPNVMMDGATWGSILAKTRWDYEDAEDSQVWELQDGAVYEQDKYKQPKLSQKFYNSLKTFQYQISIAKRQARSAWESGEQLAALITYLEKTVETQMTRSIDVLTAALYLNMIGDTLHDEYGTNPTGGASHTKAVNLLYRYNQKNPDATLTAANCLDSKAFLAFASKEMGLYGERMSGMSRAFNIGKTLKFTPKDEQRWVMLADFVKAADFYLEADTFHNQFVSIPESTVVPYWQGSGTDYGFDSVSKIYGTTATGNAVEQTGILAVLHDRYALGIWLAERYADSHHNAPGQFDNFWYFADANHINDYDENFVVFFIADEE